MKRIYTIIITLLICSLSVIAQSEEFEPNNTILQNSSLNTFSAPDTISAYITASTNPDSVDYLKIVLPYCSSWSFNILNPNGTPSLLRMTLYNSQNTSNWIISSSGIEFNFNNGNPSPVVLNCGETIYVKIDQISGTNLGAYSLEVTEAPFAGFECNNSYENSAVIPTDTTFEERLFGFNCSGLFDEAFYKVETNNSGVLNFDITGVNGNQALNIQVYDSSFTLVSSIGNTVNGSNVALATLLCTGTYYVRIFEFSTNTGNPYTLVNDPFTVNVTFDSSDCECNNTFETACLIPLNTNFEAKLWGLNNLNSNGTNFNQAQDQDFFKVETNSAGVLNFDISGVNGGQALNIQVYDSSYTLVSSIDNTSNGSNVALATLLCTGTYYIRIYEFSTNTGNPYTLVNDPFTVNVAFDSSDCECNNTFETACLIPLNTNFEAKLWGLNNLNSNGTNFNQAQDQDFFKVETNSAGVLNFDISGVNGGQALNIQVFDSTYTLVSSNANTANGSNVTLATLLCTGAYYIRIYEFSTNTGNPYTLVNDPFTVNVTFDSSDCECNNTFETACQIPLNSDSEVKLWGLNNLVSNNTIFDQNQDQDFFKITTTECGLFTISLLNVNSNQALNIQIYDSLFSLVLGTPINTSNGADVERNIILNSGTYYIRIYEFSTNTGNAYTLIDDPFSMTTVFSPFAQIVSTSDSICSGDSLSFSSTSSNVNTWLWNFGVNNNPSTSTNQNPENIIFNDSGQNIVTLTVNGCSIDTIVVDVLPTLPTPTISANGLLLTSSAPSGNNWYLNNILIPNATNSTYIATQNGSYSVCVSLPNSCGNPCSDTVTITNVGIDDVNLTNVVSVFPNPTNDNVTITYPTFTRQIHVTNSIGQIVFVIKNHGQNQSTFELPAAGIFFISFYSDKQVITKKLVVTK
jgi:hypothetical protein